MVNLRRPGVKSNNNELKLLKYIRQIKKAIFRVYFRFYCKLTEDVNHPS